MIVLTRPIRIYHIRNYDFGKPKFNPAEGNGHDGWRPGRQFLLNGHSGRKQVGDREGCGSRSLGGDGSLAQVSGYGLHAGW